MKFLLSCALFSTLAEAQSTLSVAYTGKTLGYYRIPNIQTALNPGHCPVVDLTKDADKQIPSVAATQFLVNAPAGAPVLLGLGDNFAPVLEARGYRNGRWYEDRYTSTGVGDNVACFFIRAGYTAMVPGKHDFFNGPEYLRNIARFLAAKGVQMLASNLTVNTILPDARPRKPKDFVDTESLGYQNGFVTEAETTDIQNLKPAGKSIFNAANRRNPIGITLPAVPLPSLREVTVRNAVTLIANGRVVQPEDLPRDEQYLIFKAPGGGTLMEMRNTKNAAVSMNLLTPDAAAPGKFALAPAPIQATLRIDKLDVCRAADNDPKKIDFTGCRVMRPKWANKPGPATASLVFRFDDPNSGPGAPPLDALTYGNWAFCLTLASGEPQRCQLFSVHQPYLNDGVAGSPEPYAIHRDTAGQRDAAVFAVVDPDLLSHIGRLNYQWRNAEFKAKAQTSVEVSDPAAALAQVFQRCDADPVCQDLPRILLAQMSPGRLQQLLSKMSGKFLIAISQADSALETLKETRILTGTASNPTFILTPGPVYSSQSPGKVGAHYGTATLTIPGAAPAANWNLTSDLAALPPQPLAHAVPVGGITFAEAVRNTVQEAFHLNGKQREFAMSSTNRVANISSVALYALRREHHSDAALLQRRDFFEAERAAVDLVDGTNLQETIDRLLWNGNLGFQAPLTGATLKEVLKQSDAYDANDQSSTPNEAETGRALITLGITKNPESGEYWINKEPIVDTRLYSVAMTDYVGFGDTGYGGLAVPAIPPALPLEKLKPLRQVGELMCEAIAKANQWIGACRNDPMKPGDLILSANKPFDPTPGFTLLARYSAFAHGIHSPRTLPEKDIAGNSIPVQPRWTLELEKLSVAYTANLRTETDNSGKVNPATTASSLFKGFSQPFLTSPGETMFSIAYRLRAQRLGRALDFFALTEMDYTRDNKRDTNGIFRLTQATNLLGQEAGILPHVMTFRRGIMNWRALASGRYNTRFLENVSNLGVTSSDPTVTLPASRLADATTLNKDSLLVGHLGTRFDRAGSWLEAGWEFSQARSVPLQFNCADALQNNGTPFVCPGTPGGRPDLKIYETTAIQVAYRNHFQQGPFVNSHVLLPLNATANPAMKWALILDNAFSLYLRRGALDTRFDTRYLEKFSPSLQIPVIGNLTITPKVDFYLFSNKGDGYHFRSASPSLAITYRFQWHSGLPWRVLRYGNPAPLPTSVALRFKPEGASLFFACPLTPDKALRRGASFGRRCPFLGRLLALLHPHRDPPLLRYWTRRGEGILN